MFVCFRTKRHVGLCPSVLGFLALAWSFAAAQIVPSRPALTGVSHISIYSSDAVATEHYYVDIVGCERASDPENPRGVRYYINETQFVEVLPLAERNSPSRLVHLGFKTSDAAKLRLYLQSRDIEVPKAVSEGSDGSRWFDVKDPEGTMIQFVQSSLRPHPVKASNLAGHHIVHIGMVVHDSAKEDKFYRDVLDFKPYWKGGLKPGTTDFITLQTPEGHDWVEYELVGNPSGSRSGTNVSQQELGNLNHFSIGVTSVARTFETLRAAGRLAQADAKTKIGRDGKWNLNIFDPDGTRLEYQEFSNVRPPCCSAFTAPNPVPID